MHLTWTLQQGMSLQAFSASDQVAVVCQQRVEFDQWEVELMVHAYTSLKVMLYQEKCNVIMKWPTLSQQLLTLVIFKASSVDGWAIMWCILTVALWRIIMNMPTYDKEYLTANKIWVIVYTHLAAS